MVEDYQISTPFFEFGPKAYLYGEEQINLEIVDAELPHRFTIIYVLP